MQKSVHIVYKSICGTKSDPSIEKSEVNENDCRRKKNNERKSCVSVFEKRNYAHCDRCKGQ